MQSFIIDPSFFALCHCIFRYPIPIPLFIWIILNNFPRRRKYNSCIHGGKKRIECVIINFYINNIVQKLINNRFLNDNMPDKGQFRTRCGSECTRCWRNKLKHANKLKKKTIPKTKHVVYG